MMKIDIPIPVPMAMSGKSVLSMMGKSISSIDLLVRESLQNSLDACLDSYENKYVNVNFNIGQFKTCELNGHLNSLGKQINRIITNTYSDFIAVEDKNTVGLNGPIKSQNYNYGNFRKLVYEIAKPQQKEDSGGSWGYGKSVYFRIGIGLVIFYSRFKDENNYFKERLACTYIEDETSPKSLLSKIQSINRGIAWLGDFDDLDNSSRPIEDSYEISTVLSIFGLLNFSGNDTGTRIIIPYIDKNKLLNDINNKREKHYNAETYFWKDSFEETLKNSILLWYTPRINNIEYTKTFKKPYLLVHINNERIKFNESENYFYKVISELYKASLNNNRNILSEYNPNLDNLIDFRVSSVKYSNLTGNQQAGSIAFCKVPIDSFDVSPYTYLGKENQADNGNRPIICFCRKPGMIIDYQLSNKWADKIPATNEDEILMGVFVLNTDAVIKGNYRLETYVRESEMFDHASWSDINIEGVNLGKVIFTVCKNTQKIIRDSFIADENKKDRRIIGISQKLGKLFLPSTGYGSTPTTGIKTKGVAKKTVSIARGSSLRIIDIEKNNNNELIINFELKIKNNLLNIDAIIKGIGKRENTEQWNALFNNVPPYNRNYPVRIKALVINQVFVEGSKQNILLKELYIENEAGFQNLNFELKGDDGFKTSIQIKRTSLENSRIFGSILLFTTDKGFSYSIKLNKGDEEHE